MKRTRLRIVAWHVQAEIMLDDGENLTPLDIQPVTIPHGRWDEFVGGGWQEAVEQLRAQVEQTHEPDPR